MSPIGLCTCVRVSRRVSKADRDVSLVVAPPWGFTFARREVNEASEPHTCSRSCAFEVPNAIKTKPHHIQNTARNPQRPGDCDHLETACEETRPNREPIPARLRRTRLCGNRPRLYTYLHCCCAAVTRIGALFSRQRRFFSTVVCIPVSGIIRWCLTLGFPSSHNSTCTATRDTSSAAAASCSSKRRCAEKISYLNAIR